MDSKFIVVFQKRDGPRISKDLKSEIKTRYGRISKYGKISTVRWTQDMQRFQK